MHTQAVNGAGRLALSLITLAGMTLNAAFGWWWADPVSALGMTWFLVSERREAWRGEDCGCYDA